MDRAGVEYLNTNDEGDGSFDRDYTKLRVSHYPEGDPFTGEYVEFVIVDLKRANEGYGRDVILTRDQVEHLRDFLAEVLDNWGGQPNSQDHIRELTREEVRAA